MRDFFRVWEKVAQSQHLLEDLIGVPVVTGAMVRLPTFAKAVNFQVARTIPAGPVMIEVPPGPTASLVANQ